MNIEITDQEKQELKQRALANAEDRLTKELMDEMRRRVVRDVAEGIESEAKKRLQVLLAGHITEEMLQAHIQQTLQRLADARPKYGACGSKLEELIEQALLQAMNRYADETSAELRRLLSEVLRQQLRKE